MDLFQIIAILFWLAIIICAVVTVIELHNDPDLFHHHPSKRQYVFFVAYLVALTAFVGGGIERLLFFIPASWGGLDEYGDFVSYREGTAYGVGSIIALWFGCVGLPRIFRNEKNNPKDN